MWLRLCYFGCDYCFFFFFKQKTAYDMRISDWSSDVCSSDLRHLAIHQHRVIALIGQPLDRQLAIFDRVATEPQQVEQTLRHHPEIGRASCRERVCQYV